MRLPQGFQETREHFDKSIRSKGIKENEAWNTGTKAVFLSDILGNRQQEKKGTLLENNGTFGKFDGNK